MIYNHKSDETVQDVILECYCPLVDDIADEYSTLRRYENLSIYAPSRLIREILSNLLNEDDSLWIHEDSDYELLSDEDIDVVVTIAYDGMVFVEEAKVNGVIKSNEDSCLTYFYDGLGQKDLSILEENAESILIFGFEEDTCEGCKSEDTELATTDKSQYYVNGKEVSR